MYGKDPQSLEPYLLYSSPLAHSPQGVLPALPTPIHKPRPYTRHLHRGFVDKQSIWNPSDRSHLSSLGCVLEEEEEGEELDDSKSVRNPGLRDSGYSSGSASSEDGEPDTPRESFFPASRQQMIDTHRSVHHPRKNQSLPLPLQSDNPFSNAPQTDSWPSFGRTPNHIMPPRPLVAEEPFLIYSTPSPTNCLTPPIEKALIYNTFSPKAQQPRDPFGTACALPPAISLLPSSPFRPASNLFQPRPEEPIKAKYTSSFDPFAGDPTTTFSPSPGEMIPSRNNRSRFA